MQILSNRRLPNGTKASPIFFTGKKKMHRPVVFRETDSIYIWVDRALFGRGCSSFVRKMIYTPGNFHGSNMECYISVQQTKKMKHLDDQRTTVLFCYIRGIPKAAGNLLNWMSRLCWQYRGKKKKKRCQNGAWVTERGRKECVAGVCVCFWWSVNTSTHYQRTVESLIVSPEDNLGGTQVSLIIEPRRQKKKKKKKSLKWWFNIFGKFAYCDKSVYGHVSR